MKKDKRWTINGDGALVFRPDGVRGVGGVWPGAWKTGARHVPNPKAAIALATLGAAAGIGPLSTGPHDIVAYGFLSAVWEPYERVGRFLTVAEAKAAVEQVWSAREKA